MEFQGYVRSDGRVGVRNHVLVMPTCACSSDVARMIAAKTPGTVSLNNQHGCGQVMKDQLVTLNFLSGLAANPNVHSILLVGLGCEQLNCEVMVKAIREKTN